MCIFFLSHFVCLCIYMRLLFCFHLFSLLLLSLLLFLSWCVGSVTRCCRFFFFFPFSEALFDTIFLFPHLQNGTAVCFCLFTYFCFLLNGLHSSKQNNNKKGMYEERKGLQQGTLLERGSWRRKRSDQGTAELHCCDGLFCFKTTKTRVSSKINNKKDRLFLLVVGAMRYLSSALNGARFPPFNRATTCFFLFSLPTLPFFIVVCAAYLLLCPRQLHLSHTHKQKHVAKKRAKKTPIPPFISHSLFLLSSFSRKNSSTSFFFLFWKLYRLIQRQLDRTKESGEKERQTASSLLYGFRGKTKAKEVFFFLVWWWL